MARPTKYTPETAKRILDGIELGMPYVHAAAYGGVSYETFNQWRDKKLEFSEAVKAAEGRAVAGRLARIRQAEPDHWQAAAWWLERRYPHEFGKTIQEQQHTGKDCAPLIIEIVAREDGPQ
jgi:transposase